MKTNNTKKVAKAAGLAITLPLTAHKRSPKSAYTLGAVTNKRIYMLANLEAKFNGCSVASLLSKMLEERYKGIK